MTGRGITDKGLDFQGIGSGRGLLIGDWIFRGIGSGRSLRGGAWWELDELAANQSILRGRRVRLRLGTWGGERLRRKGGLRARIEALLAVWEQAAWGGDDRVLTSESLGVKEPAFLGVGKKGQRR